MKLIKKLILIGFAILGVFLVTSKGYALDFSDLISTSHPSANADHLLKFTVMENIPPSGKIEVIPENGVFYVPADMSYEDVDFAVADDIQGVFTERSVAPIVDGSSDGVLVLGNQPNSKVVITMNSAQGVSAGQAVRIKIGANAVFGLQGNSQIQNPVNDGSYAVGVKTYDNANASLENLYGRIAIVQPVQMNSLVRGRMMNGNPNGWLTYGTGQTILSLMTNYTGICRYSVASNTPYNLMAGQFSYVDGASSTYHTALLSSLSAGNEYNYFIRCQSGAGTIDAENICTYIASTTPYHESDGTPITEMLCYEYQVHFQISSISGAVGGVDAGDGGGGSSSGSGSGSNPSDGGSTSGTGTHTSGGGGGGGGGGAGSATGNVSNTGTLGTVGIVFGAGLPDMKPYPPYPSAPGVLMQGYSFPNSTVIILKDGKEIGKVKAAVDGRFSAFLEGLTKGVYAFGAKSEDTLKRKTIVYSATIWVNDGSQSTISDIVLAPTISLTKTEYRKDELTEVSGQAPAQATIEVQILPDRTGKIPDNEIVKKEVKATAGGLWSASISMAKSANGRYRVKARAKVSESAMSEFGDILLMALGESLSPAGACEKGDLNKDGKVNLVDFSILLYYWNTSNACADQNKDKTVNLTDFSIMMYYWTG